MGPVESDYTTSYRNNGAFIYRRSRRNNDIRDGLSNTIFLGEVVRPDTWESSNIWTLARGNLDCLRNTTNPVNTLPGYGIAVFNLNGAFASWHPGGAVFAFGDGHVEFVNERIDFSVYQAYSTIDGEEL